MRTHAGAIGAALVLCSLMAWTGTGHAARNANGAMIVHTNDAYEYSALTVCTTALGDPGTCEAAVTTANRIEGQVIWLLAAFEAAASPGVTVIYFGIDYDDAHLDPGVNYRMCGPAGSLEVPDDDWPYGGRGNSVAFGSPIAGDTLFPFYAFRVDNAGTGVGEFFCTAENPTGGYAAFVDDSNPPLMDYCTQFGCIRWGMPGSNQCPQYIALGACCFPDGRCTVEFPQDCANDGGVYQGNDTDCDPNPCPPPPSGACCDAATGACTVLTEPECAYAGGVYQGDGTTCDPNPCPVPPTGACCYPTGCSVQTPDVCAEGGGVYQGDDIPCDPDPCPVVPGACCFADGHCEILSSQDCARYAGQYHGAGTACDPNPCAQPSEACCFPAGYCQFIPRDTCEASGGNPQGPGTNCEMVACRPPQLGACCLESGTCVVNLEEECTALGGYYLAGTPCVPDPCDDTAIEPTTWGRVRASFR